MFIRTEHNDLNTMERARSTLYQGHFSLLAILVSLALLSNAGCGAAGDAASKAPGPQEPNTTWESDASSRGWNEPGGWDAGATSDTFVPPENEVDLPYGAPEPSENFVFVVNPDRGRVVVVDANTLDIHSVPVGTEPILARSLPGSDESWVINLGSSDLTRISMTEDGPETETVTTVYGVNDLRTGPNGTSAIAFYNSVRARAGDPVGSFQEISVIRLKDGVLSSTKVAVGFRPVDVQFDAQGDFAFVVTEQGLSILDLNAEQLSGVAPPIPLSDDPFEDVTEREVLVTEDGSAAIVRVLGKAEARLIPISGGAQQGMVSLQLPGEPTDIDLIPGQNVALLILREQQLAILLDIDQALTLADPYEAMSSVDTAPAHPGLATIAHDGSRAILYTTVLDEEEISVLELATGTVQRIPLKKSVVALSISPDSETAVLIHEGKVGNAQPSDVEAFIDESEGYSILHLQTGFTKLELLDAEPGPFTFTADGADLLLLESNGVSGPYSLHWVDLHSAVGERITLASDPIDVRFVPAAARAAVFQEHPSGRITFFDVLDHSSQTVTGFEMNSLID